MKIESKYDLGDLVHLDVFNKDAIISAFTFDRSGMQYKVRYVVGDEFKYEWFYEDELKDVQQKKMGFND